MNNDNRVPAWMRDMVVIKYTPIHGDVVKYAVDLQMRFGLVFHECAQCASGGREWVNLPQYRGKNNLTGETEYRPAVSFVPDNLRYAFGEAALEAIRRFRVETDYAE